MKSRKKYIIGFVVGALLMLSLPISYFGYRIGMNRAFATLAAPGGGEAKALSANIDTVLHSLVAGCVGSFVGLVVLIWSLIAYRRAIRDVSDITSA